MSVKRDRGRWRYRTTAYDANGTSVRIFGSAPPYEDTRDKALAMEAEHVARVRTLRPSQEDATQPTPIAAPTEPAKPPPVPTVREWLPRYLEFERVNNKPSTMRNKVRDFNLHILPSLGDLRLDQVTYAVIEDWKLALTKTPCGRVKHKVRLLSAKTIQNLLAHLSDLLSRARKREIIASVPHIDWLKLPPQEFDFLDFEEADRLLAAAEPAWRTMILVAMRTGMRMGELLALRWDDVDFAVGQINVRQSYVKGVFGLPKGKKFREIGLGEDVREALLAHKHDRGPLVFCDDSGHVLSAGKLVAPLRRACKGAGLRAIGWHTLRHTFASHLAMRGVPLKFIQELLGHSSITTTMRYAHLAPHVTREAVRVLDRPRTAVTPPNPAPNSSPTTAPTPAISVEVAKDWRKSDPDAVAN